MTTTTSKKEIPAEKLGGFLLITSAVLPAVIVFLALVQDSPGAAAFGTVVALVSGLLAMTPTAIALQRRTGRAQLVFILTVFLPGLGWIIGLVMALTYKGEEQRALEALRHAELVAAARGGYPATSSTEVAR